VGFDGITQAIHPQMTQMPTLALDDRRRPRGFAARWSFSQWLAGKATRESA